VVLYEMVTGRKPFQGDSQYSIMAAHMAGSPVAPSDAAPWMPRPLNDVILKALAKDPADRFPSAAAFKSALASAAGADQVATQVMPATTAPLPGTLPGAPTQKVATVPLATAQSPSAEPGASTPTVKAAPQPEPGPEPEPAPAIPPAVIAPAPRSSGHRGLYVALGCLLTLAVLAAAAVEGPRFFRTHADGAATITHPAPAQAAPEPAPAAPTPSAEAQPSPQASSLPQTEPQTGGQEKPDTATSSHSPSSQEAQEKPVLKSRPNTEDAPSTEAQESYHQQMRELTEQADQLTIRAKTARLSLTSLKTQMSDQGLGLRSDVVEAETRMNHHLEKAKREIASGDAVSAEKDLQAAAASAEYIEKFLGR
jgi:eukaryotic-like serine/threonine-protein kinase